MSENTNRPVSPDWENVTSWAPLFIKRRKAEEEILRLEGEKVRVRNAPLSKQETKENLKNGEIKKVAEAMAIKCSTGEDLQFLVDKRQAVEFWARAALIAEARKAVDRIPDEDWPAGARSEQQKQDEILRCDTQIDKLRKDLDLKKIGNKRLLLHDGNGNPIKFRPNDWVEDLAAEIRQKGPTHDSSGASRYTPEKLEAMKLLAEYLP